MNVSNLLNTPKKRVQSRVALTTSSICACTSRSGTSRSGAGAGASASSATAEQSAQASSTSSSASSSIALALTSSLSLVVGDGLNGSQGDEALVSTASAHPYIYMYKKDQGVLRGGLFILTRKRDLIETIVTVLGLLSGSWDYESRDWSSGIYRERKGIKSKLKMHTRSASYQMR